MNIDGIDDIILKKLLEDARYSKRKVAKDVGLSIGTVISRIKRMEEEGLIKEYSVILDHEKLGYEFTAVTEITISKGRLDEMEKEIARIPGVCAVYDVTGVIDAMVVAKFKDREALGLFTKRLLSMPYIERTNTHVVILTVKEDFRFT